MDISRHICSYLSSNPSVIVPGLGRFTAVDKPAEIRGDAVIPPSRTVLYDSTEDGDDGVLTGYVAQQENVTVEQAGAETEEFYNMLKRKLSGRKAIMLHPLGTLSVNEVGDIVFEPDADLFVAREDCYGLEAVDLKAGATTPDAPSPEAAQAEPGASTVDSVELDESLFAGQKVRVRETADRSRTASEPQDRPARTLPPSSGRVTAQKKKTKAGSGFPAWVFLVLVAAAALGAGFYFLYPKLSTRADTTIAAAEGENRQEQGLPAAENEVPDPEVAQTLDNSTDKKTALNPSGESSPQQAKPAPTGTASQTVPAPTQAYSPGSAGSGKYLLIVGSFTTRARAEVFGKQSLQPAGINYEIIDFGNKRFRVAVASFDSKTAAYNRANEFKSKPRCENVWVLRR